jgi:ABC-2 type transport system permease protein
MSMYKVEVKGMLKSLGIWSVVMVGIIVLFMSMFPSMADSGMSEIVKTKMDAIPESMRAAFGLDDMVDFSDLLQYFAYCAQYILIGSCIYAGILGANSLIKEESEGTIEFLYAQPISRKKIVTIKLLSTLTILYIYNLIVVLGTIIICSIVSPEGYDYLFTLGSIFKSMFLPQLVFWSLGFLISSLLKKVDVATPTALGLFFITYLLGTFSKIIDKLDWMKYISPTNYAMPSDLLKNDGIIELKYASILLIITIISILFTYYRYNTKDFEI